MNSMEESLRQSLAQAMSAKADFEAGENPGTYRRDVDAWRQLVSHPFMTADHALRGEALGYLGVLYLHGYDHLGDQAGLDEAIRCLTGSLQVSDVPLITLELGDALAKRQRRDGRREDLDAAIDRLGLVLSPQEVRQRDYYLDVLGQMLVERYYQSGNLADLTAAIRAFLAAVQTAPAPAGRFNHLVSLGHALLDRGNRTGQIADLRQAVAVLTEARSLASTGSEEESRVLMILGGAYGELGRQSGQRADLDAGVQLTEAAAAISASGPEGPYLLANLAGALTQRYGQGRDPADLDRAIELFGQSLRDASPGTRSHVMRLQGLATALADRAALRASRDQAQADWRRAVEYFRAALASARSGPADRVLGVAQPWLTKAADRLDWTAAAEAASVLTGEMRLAVLAQASRDDKRTEILALAKWPALAAFALASTGRTEDAVTTLDQGRVQLLTAALDRDRADMARLTAAGQAGLAAEYRRIAADMAASEAQDRSVTLSDATNWSSQQRRLRAELEDVLAHIRHVPGYERFQAPAAYSDVAAAAEPSPLVYLFTTRFGGMALVVRSAGEPPVAVPVPGLAGDTAVKQLGTYFWAYNRRAGQPHEWSRAIDSVTRWAFEVIAPVLDYLTASSMVLIPCGPLALLPLHAAWRPDPDQPGRRRYLLDDMTITYAASARLLAEAGRLAAGAETGRVLVVEDPRPTKMRPLPAAVYEAATVLAQFPESGQRHLRNQEATRQAVTTALGDAAVWHFACHAVTRPELPLSSGVLLSGDDWFTVEDIMKLRRAGPSARLAVLSACATGVYGTEAPDEVIGFQTALLYAGVAGAVASLWPVEDRLAAALAAEFYRRWRDGVPDPAAALRAAQTWLRDARLVELHGRHPGLFPAPPPVSGAAARLLATAPAPYADPVNWAAFTFWGA